LNTFIIAEAGVNHNGSLELAFKLINVAASAGADAVKFQTYRTKLLANESAGLAAYQIANTDEIDSQVSMLSKFELSNENHIELIEHAQQQGICFLSSPFDIESVKFLCEDLKLPTIKIPSGEITNGPYLRLIASYGPDIILSTGMANIEEIRLGLDVLAHGLLGLEEPSSIDDVHGVSQTAEGYEILNRKVTLLHCTSNYPAKFETINLRAIDELRKTFGLRVGLSDHSVGISVPIAAAAIDVDVLEKHITLDKNMEGPDHKASIEPDELRKMIDSIRDVEKAMGISKKELCPEEIENRVIVRKSLFAARDINQGDVFTPEDLIALRPEEGVSPMRYWNVIGSKAKKSYSKGEQIKF